jgi:Cyclic nucleotide-binding domain/Major Facilitator Superfamily
MALSGMMHKRLAESARAFAATARNPNLRRAQGAFGATWTAEWAFTVALAFVAFRAGGATAVGVVAFVRMAPSALLAPLGTAMADRFRRDRVLVWSCLIRGAATAAAAAVLVAGGPSVTVYALAAIATAAFTMFRPAYSALLPGLCMTPRELTSAHVVRGLIDSLSMLLGPLAAALLLDLGSPAAVFATTAVLALGSGVLLMGLSYEAPPRGPLQPLRRIARETAEGFRAIAHHRDAALLIGISLAQALTRGFLNVFLVVIAFELLAMGAPGIGLLTAAVGVGAVASSLAASMFVSGRRLAALEGIGVALWGLPLTLSGAFPYEPVVLVLMGVVGAGNALIGIGLNTLPARLVPEDLLARLFGAKESLNALSVALGSLLTPFAIDLLGIRGALAVLGLVAPLLVAFAWQHLHAIDASIARRDQEVEVLNKVRMFRPLPIPAIDSLALHVDHAKVAAGEEVFHQGDHGDRFYVIESGEAEVVGDGRLIATRGPGDGFGEIALLRDTLRTTTVCARTPLRLYALDRHHFVSAISDYQSSAREAAMLMDDRLRSFAPCPVGERS